LPRQLRPKPSFDAEPNDSTDSKLGDRESVQALRRGFAIIEAFSAQGPSLTMAEVAAQTGVARAVARRYLFTLSDMGYVAEHDGRYRLTPRVLHLGFAYLSTISVASIVQPFMEKVVTALGESCSCAVLDRREILYVGRVPAKSIMRISLVIGSRLPAHATSMGKVLLAALPPDELDAFFAAGPLERFTRRTICDEHELRAELAEVRQRGWGLADQEVEAGIRSVAVPIWQHDGGIAAAINVSAHASRVSRAELCGRHLQVLLEAADDISRALGARLENRLAAAGDRAVATPRI